MSNDPNDKERMDFGRKLLQAKARDHARTPMQWSAEANAGFCKADVQPWMRVNDDYKTVNAEAERKQSSTDQLSVLQFWERALANRKENKDVFVYGDFRLLDKEHDCIFAYERYTREKSFVIVLNFSGKEIEWVLPESIKLKSWVAGNYTAGKPEKPVSGKLSMKSWEGILGH